MKEFDAVAAPLMLTFSHWTSTGEVKSPSTVLVKRMPSRRKGKVVVGVATHRTSWNPAYQ